MDKPILKVGCETYLQVESKLARPQIKLICWMHTLRNKIGLDKNRL